MQTFEYRGFDAAGRARRGLVEALGAKQAREQLAASGILVESLATGLRDRRHRFTLDRRCMVYRGLSALLGAGQPLVPALNILVESPELRDVRGQLAGVRDAVREGLSLADALARSGVAAGEFEQAIIEAAERSASVERMLDDLAGFLEEQHRLRERVQGALVYPLLVLTVGICVAIVMLGVLVPRTRQLLAGTDDTLPWVTVAVMAAGRFMMTWGAALLAVAAGAGVVALGRVRRSPARRLAWSRRLFRLPVLGRGLGLLVNLRFARTFATLLRGGLGLIDALVLAGRATGNGWVAHLAAEQAEAVRHGGRLSAAVRAIPPLAPSLPGWIEIGEAGGGLAALLDGAGKRFHDQWERYVSRCLSLLEPLLILAIGGFVLLVTLSVLLPVISLSTRIR